MNRICSLVDHGDALSWSSYKNIWSVVGLIESLLTKVVALCAIGRAETSVRETQVILPP